MDQDRHERLRARAYELWQLNGQPDGETLMFWAMAERELEVEVETPADGPEPSNPHSEQPAGSPAPEPPTS